MEATGKYLAYLGETSVTPRRLCPIDWVADGCWYVLWHVGFEKEWEHVILGIPPSVWLHLCACWTSVFPGRSALLEMIPRPPHALVPLAWFLFKAKCLSFFVCAFLITNRATLALAFLSSGRSSRRDSHEKKYNEHLSWLWISMTLVICFLLMSFPQRGSVGTILIWWSKDVVGSLFKVLVLTTSSLGICLTF